jgi:hypothetical protein
MSIVALAGRRIDAPSTVPERFPASRISVVKDRIKDQLQKVRARGLVCSMACGSDLLALTEAGRLRIKRRVVLPFEPSKFLETSVTDRPGDRATDWGTIFRSVIQELELAGDVIILGGLDNQEAYAAANARILREAELLSQQTGVEALAIRVWEGSSRGEGDLTEAFGLEASKLGLRVLDVPTT